MPELTTPQDLQAVKNYLAALEKDFRENHAEYLEAKTSGDRTALEYTHERSRLIYREITEVEYFLTHGAA